MTRVIDVDEDVFRGHRVGFLYYDTTRGSASIQEIRDEAKNHEAINAFRVTANLWHDHLGHLHKEALKKIQPLEAVVNFKTYDACETCIQGKFKRQKFYCNESNKTSEVLYRIHSDVVGPMPCHSIGRCKYFVTFINNFSNFVVAVPIKHKSEVTDEFIKYQKKYEVMHNQNKRISNR